MIPKVLVKIRTVVSSEAINDVQVIPKGLLVLFGTQDGPDLPFFVTDTIKIILREEEMMRTDFTGDW